MAQVGWIIDLKKCIGCRSCFVACKSENNTPLRTDWRYVVERESGTYPTPKREFISLACNHCDEPACDGTDGNTSKLQILSFTIWAPIPVSSSTSPTKNLRNSES